MQNFCQAGKPTLLRWISYCKSSTKVSKLYVHCYIPNTHASHVHTCKSPPFPQLSFLFFYFIMYVSHLSMLSCSAFLLSLSKSYPFALVPCLLQCSPLYLTTVTYYRTNVSQSRLKSYVRTSVQRFRIAPLHYLYLMG